MPKSRRRSPSTFPYVRFHGRYYPLIPISVKKGKITVRTFALIDSGASFSVFRPEIAEALEIKPKKKKGVRLGTAKGGIDIQVERVQMGIEKKTFNAKIGFSKNASVGFNILGRESVFVNFKICFEEKKRRVRLYPL